MKHALTNIAAALELQNPWWVAEGPIQVLPWRRREFRRLAAWATGGDPIRGALLVGFKRVGKTELARQVLDHASAELRMPPRNLVYADFQEIALAEVGPNEVVAAVRSARRVEGPLFVVFDEIQFVERWDQALRGVLRSEQSSGTRVLATGSGTADLRRASGDTLLGRAHVFRLGPMTFGEWIELTRFPSEAVEDALSRYLVRGGFPGALAIEGDATIREYLRELVERYVIDGDLARRLRIRQRHLFGKLWLHIVHNPGLTLDWSKLPNEFGVARRTFDEWIRAMLQAELAVEIEPSQLSGLPLRGRKRYSRLFPIDHAICGAYGVPPDEGHGLETLVLRHLRDLAQRRRDAGLEADLTFWRDDKLQGPNEIDFRLHGSDVDLLFEVKAARRVGERDAARVAAVAARLGVGRALVVHDGPTRSLFKKRIDAREVEIHVVPLVEFLLDIDRCSVTGEDLFHG